MKKTLDFLTELRYNNDREWFNQNKSRYRDILENNKIFFQNIYEIFQDYDKLSHIHFFRIYRDARFSKNKQPYKNNLGIVFFRTKPLFWGDYYIHLEPQKSFVGGGFWNPSTEELFRIRKEFELDNSQINKIISDETFKKYFGELKGEDAVKVAPKGFDKNNPAINLIKKKQFVAMRRFNDDEICSKDFSKEVISTFLSLRPFFDYMSDILTTNLNGEFIY